MADKYEITPPIKGWGMNIEKTDFFRPLFDSAFDIPPRPKGARIP